MNLHYSQTFVVAMLMTSKVLVPYEFTLLSNELDDDYTSFIVLVPYEFTLLSNADDEANIVEAF